MRVVDEHGFVLEGNYLLLFFPPYKAAILYRILSRRNKGFEEFAPRELAAIPPYSFVKYKIPWYDERRTGYMAEDMFYYEEKDTLMHAFVTIKPILLKNYFEFPEATRTASYLDTAVLYERADLFGFWRETKEFVFLPKIRTAFISFNSTNMFIKLVVKVKYAEYEVEPITDLDKIKEAWQLKLPVKILTMPMVKEDKSFEAKFKEVYGVDINSLKVV